MKAIILEIIEPLLPKNVKRSKPVINKGTNTATQIERFTFYTSSGNRVDINCKPQGEARYEISFGVNGNLKNDKDFFDREVLKTVFTFLPKIADKLNMNEIFLESFTDDYDTKTYKKLRDIGLLPDLIKEVESAIVIYEKNIEKTTGQIADFYKQELHRLKYFLKFLNGEEGYKWEYTNITSLTMYIRNENLDEIYKKYRLAVLSHRDEGVKVTKNRRHVIYQNLLPKFMPNWSIQDHSHSGFFAFSLTRKK
jgi:hypothetical protein